MEARTNRPDEGNGEAPAGTLGTSMGEKVRDDVEHRVDAARQAVTRADQALRDAVRERPFVAVGLALGVGYLISRGLARR